MSASTAFGGTGAGLLHGKNEQCRLRARLRDVDIAESRSLLLELALYEPSISQCLNVITNFCLSEDITIKCEGKKSTPAFQIFVNTYYRPFAVEAIRCFFLYGFVPWYPRKLMSGDIVPNILPHGMFNWTVISNGDDAVRNYSSSYAWRKTEHGVRHHRRSMKNDNATTKLEASREDQEKKKKAEASTEPEPVVPVSDRWAHLSNPQSSDDDTKQLRYAVQLIKSDLDPDDVFIHEVVLPNFNVSQCSILYATVHSPLSHILVDYKNLRDAQIRRAYADAWNTTARVFTSCQPPIQTSNEPSQSYLYYETGTSASRINNGRSYMHGRYDELERQITQPSNHVPSLYNLPSHHKIEQLGALVPCEDVPFLLEKYRRDICNILGVPFEMVFGKIGGSIQAGAAQADLAGRVFTNTVHRICKLLEALITEVYSVIYDTEQSSVQCFLNPMPRIDIKSVEDIKILWEMGAVTPDVMAQLSEVLLLNEKSGTTGKHRETTHTPSEYIRNLEVINKAQQPPKPDAAKPPKKKKKKKAK